MLTLSPEEESRFSDLINEQRQKEWLTARVLLNQLSGETELVVYDAFRKPHLESGRFHISISHSGGKVAVIMHPTGATGIDIQQITTKVWRIRHKFLSASELEACEEGEDLERLVLYWSAKEAIYKCYGRKQLIFATEMAVQPFGSIESEGHFYGKLLLAGTEKVMHLGYEKSGTCFLVYVLNT
ncbi:MAG: 4'-phosphopantetheinyl transferase family protein [Salibacteraceae bacterium]